MRRWGFWGRIRWEVTLKPCTVSSPVGDAPSESTLYYGGHVLDVLKALPEDSIQVVCTTPPRWRSREPGDGPSPDRKPVVWDEGKSCRHSFSINADGQGWCGKCDAWKGHLGQEVTPHSYVHHLVEVFQEVRRVLSPDGIVWVHLRDAYATHNRARGLKPKDLVGIPWRVALAFQEDGWWVRQDIIWVPEHPRGEAASDRPQSSHEHVFLITKNPQYHYDQQEHEAGQCSVWSTSPEQRVELMILAGTQGKGGSVLDPFSRDGLTGVVAQRCGCDFVGVDLDQKLLKVVEARLLGRRPPKEPGPPEDLISELFG